MKQSALALVLTALLLPQPAAAQESVAVVVPSDRATAEGNFSNQFPLNPRTVGTSTIRYQQVYAASEFRPGQYLIRKIAFRPDGFPNTPFNGTTGNLTITLSTTSKAVDGLSTTFADNLGADNTTVFTGNLTINTANSGPAGGPFPFDIVIDLTTPFPYDPAAGNLLLDVKNAGGGTLALLNNTFVFFDAQSSATDTTSRMYTAQSPNGADLPAGVADPVGSLGLVTQFTADFVEATSVRLTANGSDGPLTLSAGAPLRLEGYFSAAGPGLASTSVGFGVITPSAVLWLRPTGFSTTPGAFYTGPLNDLGPVTILNIASTAGMPTGTYSWFFVVYDNGTGEATYDFVDTIVTPVIP